MKPISRQSPGAGAPREHGTSDRVEVRKIACEKPDPDISPQFRILIVDRDSMSSHLLATALCQKRGVQALPVEFADLLRHLRGARADMVVLGSEANRTSPNEFDLARAVGQAHPRVLIVMLLNHPTRDSVLHAFRSGARGVFARQRPMSEFLDCVEHVRKGHLWAAERETSFLLDAIRSFPPSTLSPSDDSPLLTYREEQVVQAAARGKTNKVIASDLGLSEHTVKNYLFRAFQKLGVTSRIELFLYLMQRGQSVGMTQRGKKGFDSTDRKPSS